MLYRLSYFREIAARFRGSFAAADSETEFHSPCTNFPQVTPSALLCGCGWIRTTEVERQQIYSLPHLATLEHTLRVRIPRTAAQLRCIGKSLGRSALKITNLTFVQFLILVPYHCINVLLLSL